MLEEKHLFSVIAAHGHLWEGNGICARAKSFPEPFFQDGVGGTGMEQFWEQSRAGAESSGRHVN